MVCRLDCSRSQRARILCAFSFFWFAVPRDGVSSFFFFFLEDEALCNCFCDAEGKKCVCLSTLPPSLYFPCFTFCLILVLHMCFFIERFLLFWEICSGSKNKGGLGAVRDRKKRGKKGILRGAALHLFVSVRCICRVCCWFALFNWRL